MNLRVRLINQGQATIKLGDDLLVRFGPRARRRHNGLGSVALQE
ncbi:hypothetical protein OG963_43420 (plasmid) [Streptomyces sp. NBC_01707]